jgi:hypothetical protein
VRSSDPPAELGTFDPDAWPGSPAEGFERWLDARRAWAAEHGGSWPGPDPEPDGIDAQRQRPDEPWDPEAV